MESLRFALPPKFTRYAPFYISLLDYDSPLLKPPTLPSICLEGKEVGLLVTNYENQNFTQAKPPPSTLQNASASPQPTSLSFPR